MTETQPTLDFTRPTTRPVETLSDPTVDRVGKVRRDHPRTARAAALAATPRTGTARHRLLQAIAERPRTDEELQDDLAMAANTQRPRRVELVEGGWIEDSGETRPTRSGQEAIVWRVK